MKTMNCPHCKNEHNHFFGTLEIEGNDHYQATQIIFDGKHVIPIETEYEYRSQGNIHLLFQCESGHYFIKSFDGHKGNVYLDDNNLIKKLEKYLNNFIRNGELGYFELLGEIERFSLQTTEEGA